MKQTEVQISNWCAPNKRAATVAIWPLDDGALRHAELRGRLSISIETGCATLQLRPTADEARALIAALQSALANPAPALAEAA